MRIGIVGTGDVGNALGRGFISRGHEVMMGSREARSDKLRSFVETNGPLASGGRFEDAARFGEVIVIATLWDGTENALRMAGPANLAGKVVIDATNPLVFHANAPPDLALGHTDSGGEQVQRWLPGARVVKCFNTVGNRHMVDPDFPGGPPDMFVCGDDAEAKHTVSALCADFGWPTVDLGGIERARLLEPLCIIWVLYGLRRGAPNHAFKMLTK